MSRRAVRAVHHREQLKPPSRFGLQSTGGVIVGMGAIGIGIGAGRGIDSIHCQSCMSTARRACPSPGSGGAARLKLGMTQSAFSQCFGAALPTLRKWEQGARRPEGPARVLLRVIQSEPDAVRRALATKGADP